MFGLQVRTAPQRPPHSQRCGGGRSGITSQLPTISTFHEVKKLLRWGEELKTRCRLEEERVDLLGLEQSSGGVLLGQGWKLGLSKSCLKVGDTTKTQGH